LNVRALKFVSFALAHGVRAIDRKASDPSIPTQRNNRRRGKAMTNEKFSSIGSEQSSRRECRGFLTTFSELRIACSFGKSDNFVLGVPRYRPQYGADLLV
jgi:hypothetical protein